MNHPAQTLHRTASALATFLVLVMPPWALTRLVGSPLPRSVPDLDRMRQALEVGIPSEAIVSTLAVVAWIIWTQIAVALVAEMVGVVRRRPTARLPLFPGLQALSARLVGGSLIVVSSFNPPTLALAGATPHPPAVLVTYGSPTVAADQPPPPASGPATSPRSFAAVTVQSHDSYWSIAERHLGDGLRWREVRDANAGRRMHGGHVISADDELLRPGWTLVVPSEGSPTADHAGQADQPTIIQAERGDSLWTIAATAVEEHAGRPPSDAEVRPYWQSVVEANDGALPAGPDVIHAGQSIALPPLGPPAPPPPPAAPEQGPVPPVTSDEQPSSDPSAEPVPDEPGLPPPPTSSPEPPPETERSSSAAEVSSGEVLPVVLGGLASAGLAVGAIAAIRRGHRRFSHEHPTRPAPTTAEDDRPLHRALLHHADDTARCRLRAAMTDLARTFATDGRSSRPRVVQISAEHVDVLLDADGDPPAGWELAAGGVWSSSASFAPSKTAEVAPLLVTLGAPDDDGQIYLDLEAEQLVSLTGDAEVAARLARSMAIELALRPPSQAVEVMVVGDIVGPSLADLGRATLVDEWSDVADDVCQRASQTSDSVSASGWPSAFAGRVIDPAHDALGATVVVAARPAPPSVVEALDRHLHGTVAVVALADDEGTGTIVRCAPDELLLPAIGLRCAPQQVDDDLIEPLVHLVTASGEDDDPQAEARADAAGPVVGDANTPDPTPPPPADATPEHDVLVRLLGDITVEGGRRPLSPKPTAVVAYIALHRVVSTEQLEDACWSEPGLTDHRRRLRDLVSQCRSTIGAANLPTASDGRYRAGARLLTDLDLFSWHVERATQLAPADAAAAYRAALDLVTGKVFTYPSKASTSYTWIDVENLVNQWEVRIAGVVQQCAVIYLDLGNPGAAIEVLNHVAGALPLHSGLTEMLMRAHARMGDQRAVRTTYASYVAALDDLDLDVEPSIEALLNALRADGPRGEQQ